MDGGVAVACPKLEKNQKTAAIGSEIKRRRLTDITNVVGLGRPGGSADQEPAKPNPVTFAASKDYVDHLLKENASLSKLAEDRKIFVEFEMQKFRAMLQKASQQNSLLARTNSVMFAELNLGKDRIKSLQHEIGCMSAALKVKNFELEELKSMRRMGERISSDVQGGDEKQNLGIAVDAFVIEKEKKACETSRKRPSKRQFLSSSTKTNQETAKTERRRSSRRSAVMKPEPCGSLVDISEMEDSPASSPPIMELKQEEGHARPCSLEPSTLSSSSKPANEQEYDAGSDMDHKQKPERASLCRSVRRAAGMVLSYKEVPLNVKMRRKD